MYVDGIGTNKNDVDGVKYLESAAASGYIPAQNTLGKMYYEGKGVSQDYQKSFDFFKLAADQGDAGSAYALAYICIIRRELEKDLKMGMAYLERAATRGYLRAQKFLGEIYLSGEYGISQDYKKAFQYYKSASDQHSDIDAKYNVGCMYIKGVGIEKNLCIGIEYLEWAAIRGYFKAQTMLGRFYSEGRYVNKDDRESLCFFKLAADQGEPESQYIVGIMYIHGVGGDRNVQEGERYLALARNSGYSSISK